MVIQMTTNKENSLTSRVHIKRIMDKKTVDHCGFWLGKPQVETISLLNESLGTNSLEEIKIRFKDDIRWITPHYYKSTYQHPKGYSMRPWKEQNPHGLSGLGPLSNAESVSDLDKVNFPQSNYLNFDECLTTLKKADDVYRLSGFWAPFYHDLCYLFGTEELLIFMITEPALVKAALDKICNFYYEANELFFSAAGDLVDALFIGNDFGTQNGMMFSPDMFREYYLPWIKKFAEQAHRYGHHFVLHSCGDIYDIIADLSDAGVDCLHPLQTTAVGMKLSKLSQNFKDKMTFMGGIDTQNLLLKGSVQDIDNSIKDLFNAFGSRFILGPSHEALLPTINVENVIRMADNNRFYSE
jgi:uroporphyrinogen decarboxylase